ncbi:hypothetical protein TNCV_3090441 [Trichonephila clavipes]|nr:hypothetical protein TNCV_3090441 [Trichonephila clavipes]
METDYFGLRGLGQTVRSPCQRKIYWVSMVICKNPTGESTIKVTCDSQSGLYGTYFGLRDLGQTVSMVDDPCQYIGGPWDKGLYDKGHVSIVQNYDIRR